MADIQGPPAPHASSAKVVLPPLPSTPSPLPTAQTLRTWLPLYLKKADATIAHLSRILSTPSGMDTFLLAIGYSTLATSSLISRISLHRLYARILRLFSYLATSVPANTAILLTPTAIEVPRLLRISQSLKALSDLIGDFRIFVRLWGLLGIWEWGKGLLDNPPKDKILKGIAWAEVSVNVAYQVLENGAYLASKGILGWDFTKQTKAWVWSSRFWAAHVGLELIRLAYVKNHGAGKGKEKEDGVQDQEKLWRKDLVVNLAYAPLTLHWSREGGLVSDLWVGALGTVAGVVGLKELWKNTC